MASCGGTWATSILSAAILTAISSVAGSARADVISTTPTLPLLGVPYVASAGAGCFPNAGLCVSGGSLTFTSLVSDTSNASGEDLVADATYTATLTDTANNPIGPVTLTGTVEQEVLGRTSPTQTGSWAVDLTAVSLSGPVEGDTLSLGLDPSATSSGTTSITAIGDAGFLINSFFDVFADLELDSTPPLQTGIGPIALTAVTPAPEPAGLALLCLPFLTLWGVRNTGARTLS